jgi:HK97 family phage portal protein
MSERRKLSDIIFNRSNNERKYFNFFRDDSSYYGNNNFIQGWNTRAGEWNVDTMGNGASNSAVVACLQLLGTSFSEADLVVEFIKDSGETEYLPNHPLEKLMKRPNPYMSGDVLAQYMINAIHVSGDAYLLKQRNNAGQVVALYPLMPEQVTPKGNKVDLITHYEYESDQQQKIVLLKKDIVHIRLGLNPTNHKKGFSPLQSVLREIYGDESAGQLATALLSNMGVPSVVITPADNYGLTDTDAEQISRTYQQKVSGRNKGMPLILSGQMKLEKMSFSPQELDIGTLRRVPEERISAVLGVPAILAGLGAGLESATYSNARTLRELFTENKLIPMWRTVAQELTHQLLNVDYLNDAELVAVYDFNNVRALQTDLNEIYTRLNVAVQGGWMSVAEARREVGLPVQENQDIYFVPNNKIPTPADLLSDTGETVLPTFEEIETEAEYDAELVDETIEESSIDRKVETKRIELIDGEYCVYSEETNKLFGCYPTRELAQARLEQIERFGEQGKAMIDEDMFDNPLEAEDRSKVLGCFIGEGNSFHEHQDENGNLIYMPCATHEEYEQIIES